MTNYIVLYFTADLRYALMMVQVYENRNVCFYEIKVNSKETFFAFLALTFVYLFTYVCIVRKYYVELDNFIHSLMRLINHCS